MTTLGAASTAANGGGGRGRKQLARQTQSGGSGGSGRCHLVGGLESRAESPPGSDEARPPACNWGSAKRHVAERVTTVESEVTKQLQTTLALLKQLTDKQDNQGAKIAEVVEGQRYLEDKMEANQRSLEERIEKLETAGVNPGQSITSMATTDDGIGGRKPALIMGGWGDNTPANEVMEKATQILRQLKVDIDHQDTFVPGIRRGFALIPLKGARVGEGSEEYRQRIQRAITVVRNAKIQTGHVREDTGQPRYAYLTISKLGASSWHSTLVTGIPRTHTLQSRVSPRWLSSQALISSMGLPGPDIFDGSSGHGRFATPLSRLNSLKELVRPFANRLTIIELGVADWLGGLSHAMT